MITRKMKSMETLKLLKGKALDSVTYQEPCGEIVRRVGFPKVPYFLVPEVGIEPTRKQVPLDFESCAPYFV